MRSITYADWLAEARAKFGDDSMQWRFQCPSCGHVASVADWRAAGATEGEVAFSCVGRRTGAPDERTFAYRGGPCQYAGGGFFRLNPVTVTNTPSGQDTTVFEFAPATAEAA